MSRVPTTPLAAIAGRPLAWLVVALAGSPFGCVEYRRSQLEREPLP